MRTRILLSLLTTLLALPALSQTTPIPLNDHERLGQRFSATRPVVTVAVCVPSWSDNEGGLTLTLWDSPDRKQKLAERVATGIRDNEFVELRPEQPLPPGSYYWEISARTGTTRIGLYCVALTADTEDCAWFDAQPQPRSRFNYRIDVGPPARDSVALLIARLGDGSAEEQESACRELAVYGTVEAVPALAKLLAEPKLSHMARYALESLPGESVDLALVAALSSLQGDLLIGVINSVAVRRTAGATGRLLELLRLDDAAVAGAAAVALGELGSQAAANALGQALDGVVARPAAFYEGALRCAGRLLADGQPQAAAALYERLLAKSAPRAVQLAAARGEVLARGPDGLALLLRLLRDEDPERRGVGLWLAQHELPGEATTRALAEAMPPLPEATQGLLLAALAGRGDPAALPAVQAAADVGPKPVRLAAIRVMPQFGSGATPGLLRLLDEPDLELAQAAQNAIGELPRTDAAMVAADLLRSPEVARRRFAIALVRRMQRASFGPALCLALRDSAAEVRLDAAKALEELGAADAVGPLREALLATPEAAEATAYERALTAAAVRAGTPDMVAAQLLVGFEQRTPALSIALLRVLGAVGGTKALEAVRQAVAGPASEVRTTALELLCGWPSAAAAPDLLQLARGGAAGEPLTCLRAVLRLAGSEDVPADQRLQLCRDAAPLIQRDEERKLWLGALGGLASYEALELALPYLTTAVKDEACAAVVGIAEKLLKTAEVGKLAAPLQQVAKAGSPDVAKRAEELLAKVTPAN